MFGPQEHLIGWLIYFGTTMLILVVFWQLTRPIPWLYLKQGLRLVGTIFLLVPIGVEDTSFYAPAWVVGFLQLIFSGVEGFMPIGHLLLTAVLIGLIVYVIASIAWFFYSAKRNKSAEAES